MSPINFPDLPSDIDVRYPDRSPGDVEHQQMHDTVNAKFSEINAAGGVATGDDLAGVAGAVESVNGETGAVVLDAADVGASPAGHTHAANVESVNGETGVVVLDAADVGAVAAALATTKGDLLVRTSSGLVRLPVGTDDQILVADSAEATGVKWTTPASGGGTPGAWTAFSSFGANVAAHDGSTYHTPRARLNPSGDGVELRGAVVTSGSLSTGSTLCTLPPGHRPSKAVGATMARLAGSSFTMSLEIATSGAVTVASTTSADIWRLDGITFTL